MKTKNILAIILFLVSALLSSCYKEKLVPEGDGLPDWTAASHGSTATPDYNKIFDDSKVQRLDIVIQPEYWAMMTENLEEMLGVSNQSGPPGHPPQQQNPDTEEDGSSNPVYVPCSVFYEGREWYYVGIRFKGNSSLRTVFSAGIKKMPFRLEFNHFEEDYPQIYGQSFYGFKQLSLGNNLMICL
jgi:spore coat protein CotH